MNQETSAPTTFNIGKTMILHGTNFGNVWQASGATNFHGKGWWYYGLGKMFGLSFKGATFVAKTTTLLPRTGNMPLRKNGMTPKELLPRSIYINAQSWKQGAALNAVSLSGPGLEFLLRRGVWQHQKRPFFISLMSLASTPEGRLAELEGCASLLKENKERFKAAWGIQVNFSCPNGGVRPEDLVHEVIPCLEVLAEVGVPLMPKFGPDILPQTAVEIGKHPLCDAICAFNTLPWDKLFEIERQLHFGTTTSPLVKYFGESSKGGVSGTPLQARLLPWLCEVRQRGLRKPICAGGGILSYEDAVRTIESGATDIFLGSVAFLRPWRVQSIIQRTTSFLEDRETSLAVATPPEWA